MDNLKQDFFKTIKFILFTTNLITKILKTLFFKPNINKRNILADIAKYSTFEKNLYFLLKL